MGKRTSRRDFLKTGAAGLAAGNVDTVFIAGKAMKWRGKLVDVNLKKHRDMVLESRQYLFDQRGFTLNLFG